MEKHKALGKGLQALIPEAQENDTGALATSVRTGLTTVDISEIKPNRFQPRTAFKAEKLDELVASIREKGIVQPVLVRKAEKGYELIAGERRFRAAQRLNLQKMPVIIKEVDDVNAMELALIEKYSARGFKPDRRSESV